ncbi:MAG: hypothetical protein J0M15_12010 [Deltaproteobacteria bacterium]|nr:hypothetical protein [Deltaproteobacteria bacterium]
MIFFFGDLVDELGLTAGQVTLPAGQNSVNVTVPLVSNPSEGADKLISLGISSVTGPHGIGNSSIGNILVRDAQRAATASVLDFGYYGECQILTNGDLVCTGSVGGGGGASKYAEGYKKLNVGTTFKEIITDQSFDCALSTSNELYCWGWGFDGNLGQGTNVDIASPTKINGFTWKKVEAQQDWNVVCGIDINDNLYCWGDQSYTDGAVGIGTTTDVRSPALVDSPNKYAEINITGGSYNSKVCGITTTGILKCWGHGPLGNGTTSNSNIPVTTDAGTLYSKIFLKGISCGITVAGAVKCWNSNHLSPVVLDDSRVYTKVAAGSSLCALTNLGQIYCFGTSPDFQSPILVDSQNTYTDLFALDYNRGMCALRSDQKVACWGTPTAGDNQKSYFSMTPVLWDEESYARLKVTRKGICGITIYGYLKCISFPDYIRYANTEAPLANTDTLLSYPSTINYKSVRNLCATDISDKLRCWKATQNSSDNTNYYRSNPLSYFPGETFQQISIKCGITGLGVLKCWGDGPLGDGSKNKSDSPIVIDPGVSYSKINVTNFNQRAGLTTTGDIKTWGPGVNSDYYNLGTGDKLERLTPTTILSNITNFSYNDSLGCAINTSGLLKCWGNAYTVKMGDGITEYSLSPVSISPGISFSDVSVSSQRVCAIRASDHRVMCWGAGPVGDGTSSTRSVFTLTTDTSPYDRLEVGTLACGKVETVSPTKQIKCWGESSKLSPTLVYTGSFRDMTWASGTLIIIDDNGKLFYLKKSFNVPGVPDASKFFQFVLGLVDRTLSILP